MRFWTIFHCSVSLLVILSPLALGQYQQHSQSSYAVVSSSANNIYSSPSNSPGIANDFKSPQYQTFDNQPGNFGAPNANPNNLINNDNQLPLVQPQPFSDQRGGFTTSNTNINNAGEPESFNTPNDNLRIPEYQSPYQHERIRRFSTNDRQYQSPSNQPRIGNTGSRRPQYLGRQTPNVNNYDSAITGPQNNQRRRVATDRNQHQIPKQDQRSFARNPGARRNWFGPRGFQRGFNPQRTSNPPASFSNSQFPQRPQTSVVHTYPNQTSRPVTPKPTPAPDEDPLKGRRIVCLFNSKHFYRNRFSPKDIDPTLCTHINYEFAILDPSTFEMISGEPDLDIQEDFFKMAVGLKKINPKLIVLISLGGWEDSTEKYSIMAADEKKRKNFVDNAVQFIDVHNFDGLDLAWEYPNCWKGALGVQPKDKENFVELLKEMYTPLKKRGLVFSISVGAVKREIEAAYDVPKIMQYVDYINVMTYDMHGPWERRTGHHMQFDNIEGDEDPYCNVKAALQVWVDLAAGKGKDKDEQKEKAAKKKMNMGIATYGKTYTLASEDEHGLGAAAIGMGDSGIDIVEGGFVLYNTMCQWLNAGNWTEVEHRQAGFYAYSGDQWACYDPPMMCVRKAKFVVEHGYGGLLIKDLGGDDFSGCCFSMKFPLLKMIVLEVRQQIKKMEKRKN